MNIDYEKYRQDLEASQLIWNPNGFWELESNFVWNLKQGRCSFCSKELIGMYGGKGFSAQFCEEHREAKEKLSSIHNDVLQQKIKEVKMADTNKKGKKVNLGEMFGDNSKVIAKPKASKELLTTEIKLSNIKLEAKKPKAKGVKKNIYFDSESWEIVEKIKAKKGYSSYAETIQALVKAHKA